MRRWWLALLVAVVYVVSGKLGLFLALLQQNVTPVWPPSGIALAALLLWGVTLWPAVFAGAFLVNYSSELPVLTAVLIAVGNTLEALSAYWILRRFFRFRNDFARMRDVLALVFVGAVLSSLLAAVFGAGSLLVTGVIPSGIFVPVLSTWWLGDAVGILIVTPLILVWATAGRDRPRGLRVVESLLLGLTLLAGSFYFMRDGFQAAYSLFPVLIWAAYRFGQWGAVTAVAVVSTVSVLYTIQVTDLGPGDLAPKLFEFQSFIGITAVTMMMFAAAITERKRLEEERIMLVRAQAAETQSQESRKRISFLSEASKTLAATLDYRATLQNVTRLAVPALADICVIDILQDDGGRRRYSAVDGDPELERKIDSFSGNALRSTPITETLQSGAIFLVPQVDEELIRALAVSPQHEEALRSVGLRSLMALPMLARGRPLGMMVLATTVSRRTFGEEDRILAEELRYRITMAIENAMLYAESQKAVDLRNEFLSVAAHELKTPVTSILGFSQILLRQLNAGITDSGLFRQGLESMDRQSGKLARLIAQLLDISRIEAGRLAIDRQPTDLGELVMAVVQAARSQAVRHSLVVDVTPDVCAFVDPIRIEQVISNLLGNAIKYSAPDSQIELSVQRVQEQVRIAVRDFGAGIGAEALPYVFDRFYQANPNSYMAGMGLGLYISKEIVQLHGGSIVVEAPEGGGTRLTVSLPLGSQASTRDS